MILKMINIGAGPQIYMYIFNYFPIRVCDSNQEVRTCMYLSGPHLSFPIRCQSTVGPHEFQCTPIGQTKQTTITTETETQPETEPNTATKPRKSNTKLFSSKRSQQLEERKTKKIVFLSWWRSLCLVLCFTTQIWGVYGGYIVATVPQLNWEGMKRVTGLFIPYFRPYFDFVY